MVVSVAISPAPAIHVPADELKDHFEHIHINYDRCLEAIKGRDDSERTADAVCRRHKAWSSAMPGLGRAWLLICRKAVPNPSRLWYLPVKQKFLSENYPAFWKLQGRIASLP